MKLSLLYALAGVALALTACDDGAKKPDPSGSAAPSASAEQPGAPKIVAVDPVFEFGKVKLGATVEHVFEVRNGGTAPLEIARAKGS